MKYTTRLDVTRDPAGARLEDWHAAAVTQRLFLLTPGHRSASWRRRTVTEVRVAVRHEAGSLHEAAEATERALSLLAPPYRAVVVSVEPTSWQHRATQVTHG